MNSLSKTMNDKKSFGMHTLHCLGDLQVVELNNNHGTENEKIDSRKEDMTRDIT